MNSNWDRIKLVKKESRTHANLHDRSAFSSIKNILFQIPAS